MLPRCDVCPSSDTLRCVTRSRPVKWYMPDARPMAGDAMVRDRRMVAWGSMLADDSRWYSATLLSACGGPATNTRTTPSEDSEPSLLAAGSSCQSTRRGAGKQYSRSRGVRPARRPCVVGPATVGRRYRSRCNGGGRWTPQMTSCEACSLHKPHATGMVISRSREHDDGTRNKQGEAAGGGLQSPRTGVA